MRAVELAAAKIAREQRQPGAAEQAAGIAHRIVAVVAGPVRHRRAVDDERAGDVGPRRGEHHHRPAALAIADEHRFGAFRVPLGDDADEFGFGIGDVGERLAGLGLRKEDHEVDRVAGLQARRRLRNLP